MLALPLEPTDHKANPAFKDAAACAVWLNQLQLTNLHLAHATLLAQLNELNRFAMRGTERLRVLEILRETVDPVQKDYAKKLILKKLPFSADERAIFVAINALWQSMTTGYQRCLQSCFAGESPLSAEVALLCQRCLEYTGAQIFEHLRSSYEFDPQLWQQLHGLYAYAEAQGFQRIPIKTGALTVSCETVYLKTLLTGFAKPAEMSRTQLQMMDRWLVRWQEALTLEHRASVSQGDAPPLAVDLAGSHGLSPFALMPPAPTVRYLAMVPLSKLLRVKSLLLQQGQSAQQLDLGSEMSGAECAEFMQRLHRNWCEIATERLAERLAVAQTALTVCSIEGIYAHLAKKPFRDNAGKRTPFDNSMAHKQIAAFGRVLSDTDRFDLNQLGFSPDIWRIENESIWGVRLLRESHQGSRLTVHQIIAVRPDDASAFMLGKISWLTVMRNGFLRVGINYMPGLAQAISLKGRGINPTLHEKPMAALRLPEMVSLKVPTSLIVPKDTFQNARVMEMSQGDGSRQNVKLETLIDKGSDFERVGFSVID